MKRKKKDARALAYLQAQEMKRQARDLLDGVDPPQESPAICADDPAEQETLDAINRITAWAANSYVTYKQAQNRAAVILDLVLRSLETGTPETDLKELQKNAAGMVDDFIFYSCMLSAYNLLFDAVGERYDIVDTLRLFSTPEDDLRATAAKLEERAALLPPVKETAKLRALFKDLTDKAAQDPDIDPGIEQAENILQKWGNDPKKFDREKIENAAFSAEQYDRIKTVKKIEMYYTPLDKITREIMPFLVPSKNVMPGQYTFSQIIPVDVSNRNNPQPINVNFKISADPTPYGRRLEEGAYSLMRAGAQTFTVNQLYYAMGGKGNPSAADRTKIQKFVEILRGISCEIDNAREVEAYKNRALVRYNGSYFPSETISIYINGEFTDGAIRMLATPPRMRFAADRKQITSNPIEVLQTPLSLTDTNIILEEYFRQQIATMRKNKDFERRMLLDTIYRHAGVSTKMQRQRAPKKIAQLLIYYAQINFIDGIRNADSIKRGALPIPVTEEEEQNTIEKLSKQLKRNGYVDLIVKAKKG